MEMCCFSRIRVLALLLVSLAFSCGRIHGQPAIDEITGEWVVVSHMFAGKSVNNDLFDTAVISEGRVMYYGRQGVDEGRYRINPNAAPKHIDLIVEQHGRSRVMRGIYKFEGATLVICQNPIGQPRPTAFESTEDERNSLIVFERKPRDGNSKHP